MASAVGYTSRAGIGVPWTLPPGASHVLGWFLAPSMTGRCLYFAFLPQQVTSVPGSASGASDYTSMSYGFEGLQERSLDVDSLSTFKEVGTNGGACQGACAGVMAAGGTRVVVFSESKDHLTKAKEQKRHHRRMVSRSLSIDLKIPLIGVSIVMGKKVFSSSGEMKRYWHPFGPNN